MERDEPRQLSTLLSLESGGEIAIVLRCGTLLIRYLCGKLFFFPSYLVYTGATGDKTNVVPVEINTGAIKMHHKQRLAV